MKHFLKYSLSWVSQNLAVPFWTVGHIHLMTTTYQDLIEIWTSIWYEHNSSSRIHTRFYRI